MKKYKKIDKGVYEITSNDDIKVGVIKLEDIERSRDYYKTKHKEMDELYKLLSKTKGQ